MGILYKSKRVGKNGRIFVMYKLKTLKDGAGNSEFAGQDSYTRFGRFFRKWKIDELPQLWNVLKGDMSLFGYRPEEPRTFYLMPGYLQDVFLKHKPGIIDMSSVYFIDEERILQLSADPQKTFYEQIKPMKTVLQFFYFEHKSLLLKMAILWAFIKRILKGK